MVMVKIRIPDKAQSAQALVALSGRGRVDCFQHDVYMVPEPALASLADLGVTYQELDRGGLDYAEKTLRNSRAIFEIEIPLVSRTVTM